MKLISLINNSFIRFCFSFGVIFLLLYFGIKFIIGLAVPEGMYSPFIEKYFNIASWFRGFLIYATKAFLALFGTHTVRVDEYVLRVVNGSGVKIVYSCIGFAVLSFWTAYVVATKTCLTKKISWLIAGLIIICFINILRISLVLLSNNARWTFPFGWGHHTWFNIIAYLSIFTMMFFFEKSIKKSL